MQCATRVERMYGCHPQTSSGDQHRGEIFSISRHECSRSHPSVYKARVPSNPEAFKKVGLALQGSSATLSSTALKVHYKVSRGFLTC